MEKIIKIKEIPIKVEILINTMDPIINPIIIIIQTNPMVASATIINQIIIHLPLTTLAENSVETSILIFPANSKTNAAENTALT